MYKVADLSREKIFYAADTQEDVTYWLDNLLRTINKGNLMSALNEMQAQGCQWPQEDYGVFENKFTIPLYFVNLLLKDVNLRIMEGD